MLLLCIETLIDVASGHVRVLLDRIVDLPQQDGSEDQGENDLDVLEKRNGLHLSGAAFFRSLMAFQSRRTAVDGSERLTPQNAFLVVSK